MREEKGNMEEQPNAGTGKDDVSIIISYTNPTGDEYPVIACNSYLFPTGKHTTEDQVRAYLQNVKACGFNATTWICEGHSEVWQNLIRTYYKVAYSLSLRTIYMIQNLMPVVEGKVSESSQIDATTYDPSLKEIKDFINKYKVNRNLWGYKLCDEPDFIEWGFTTPTAPVGTEDLPAMVRTFRQNSNGRVGYITLPVAVSMDIVGKEIFNSGGTNKEKYAKYLNAIHEKFGLPLVTVDKYPVLIDREHNEQHAKVVDDYYYYLEAIGDFSRQKNVRVWMYMLSTQYVNIGANRKVITEHPLPTEGILRFQAMTALAFGFQGLVFWTYPLNKNRNNEEFLMALIDNNEQVTEIWYNSKAVIPEIKYYGKELLEAKYQESRHVYGSARSVPFPGTTTFASGMECINNITSDGEGVVMTRLTKGSDSYIAIVSHDPFESVNIELTLSNSYNWTVMGPSRNLDDGSKESIGGANPDVPPQMFRRATLKPGGMMLIRYTAK